MRYVLPAAVILGAAIIGGAIIAAPVLSPYRLVAASQHSAWGIHTISGKISYCVWQDSMRETPAEVVCH